MRSGPATSFAEDFAWQERFRTAQTEEAKCGRHLLNGLVGGERSFSIAA
jgi:hypothetical protein